MRNMAAMLAITADVLARFDLFAADYWISFGLNY